MYYKLTRKVLIEKKIKKIINNWKQKITE
jgi:hypothetical protein